MRELYTYFLHELFKNFTNKFLKDTKFDNLLATPNTKCNEYEASANTAVVGMFRGEVCDSNNEVINPKINFLRSTFLSLENSLNTVIGIFKSKVDTFISNPIVGGLFYQDMATDLSYINTQLIVMVFLASVLYYLSKLLSKKIFNLDKKSAYECGFEPFLILTTFIEVGFILVAFIFLIFDLELIFLSAFLFSSGSIGSFGILIVLLYLFSVWVMVFFEVFSGVLSWPVWSEYAKIYTIWVTFVTVDFLNSLVSGVNRWYRFRGFYILPNADLEFSRLGKFDHLTDCRYKVFKEGSDFIDNVYFYNFYEMPNLVVEKKLEKLCNFLLSVSYIRSAKNLIGKRTCILHARYFYNLMEEMQCYWTKVAKSIRRYAPSNSFLNYDDFFYICNEFNVKTFEVAPPEFDYRISLTLTKTKRPHASLGRSFGSYYDCFRPEQEKSIINYRAVQILVRDYCIKPDLTANQETLLTRSLIAHEDLAFNQEFLGFWGLYYDGV